MPRRLTLLLALLIASRALAFAQPASTALPALEEVLARAGETVERYYARAQSIMSTETVMQQSLGYDLSPDGTLARHLVYDRRVAWDAAVDGSAPEAQIQRELIRIGNRAPRPKDKPRCFDPAASEPDDLQILLPVNRGEYTFALAGWGRVDRERAVMLDFRERVVGPVTFRKKEDVDDCYFVDLPGRKRGRIWLAVGTFDVLRIDARLTGPVSVRKSARELKSRNDIEATFDRDDSSTIYKPVHFTDPDEILVLPASVSSLTVQTGHRQREIRDFTNYRRFVTEGRIVEEQ